MQFSSMRQAIYSFVIVLVFLSISCSKTSNNPVDNSQLIGKWKILSSTIYEISNGSLLPYRRLDHPILADSVFFNTDGTLKSYALTYNIGSGSFTYSYTPSLNLLVTNINQSLNFQTQFLPTNLLILSRELKDTTSIVPLEVKQLKAIDSLYKQ